MAANRYNLDDINKIKQKGFSFDIPEKTHDLIVKLSKLVGSPDYIKTPLFHKVKKREDKEKNEPDWDLLKQFKPTQKATRTDNEQVVQDIKGSLNKMTDQNYETLREKIMTDLSSLENTDEYHRILDIIFNVASGNRFYSKVYATLYKELIEHSSEIFKTRLTAELENYVTRFMDLKAVDANEDYEAFCENNKKNEQLKALTEFFVNLMLMEVVSVEVVAKLYDDLISLVNKFKTDADHKHNIVELSENIFILLKIGASQFSESGCLDEMRAVGAALGKVKVKEFPGFSNKSLFKFMDITDIKV